MGGGSWSSNAYEDARQARVAKGVPAFKYNADVKRGKIKTVHPDLDASKIAGPTSPVAGRPIRESRDSSEHPDSLPIAVLFDVTGSMGHIPKILQTKLPKLMDVVIERSGVAHPQVLVGAIGDSYSDKYPFQVGQFESDNRFDEQLRNIILEGGGGGQAKESYGLAYKFAADHTATDSFELRAKKGYLFTMGDEAPWPTITRKEVKTVFGVTVEVDEPIESVLKRATEKWEIFHLCSMDGSYPDNQKIHKKWKNLLGERYIKVADSSMICEVIAGIVHMLESASDPQETVQSIGLSGKEASTVANALSSLGAATKKRIATVGLPGSHGVSTI
jgi:hypothetical protein